LGLVDEEADVPTPPPTREPVDPGVRLLGVELVRMTAGLVELVVRARSLAMLLTLFLCSFHLSIDFAT